MIDEVKRLLSRLVEYLKSLFRRVAYQNQSEVAWRKRAHRLLDYYEGNQLNYLDEVINEQFISPRFLKLQPQMSNIVRYITDQLCQTFKNGVVITADSDTDQGLYDELIDTTNLDHFLNDLEKLVFLAKTVHVKVAWRNDELALEMITPEYVAVEEDENDPLQASLLMFPKEVVSSPGGQPKGTFHVWTTSSYKVVNERNLAEGAEESNPYGVIPLVPFRDYTPRDGGYFARVGEELVNAQDSLNVKLTELNYLLKFQSFSVPVITNPAVGADGQLTISIDPSKPIVIKDSKEQAGKFEFVTPQARLAEVQEAVDKEYLRIFSFYGVPTGDFVATAERQSAEAMKANNAKIEEFREAHGAMFLPQIRELLRIIRIIYNAHSTGAKFSEDDPTIDIQPSEINLADPEEVRKDYDWKLGHALITEAQILVELEDDLTLEEAEEIIAENRKSKQQNIPAQLKGAQVGPEEKPTEEPSSADLNNVSPDVIQ